MLPPSSVGTSTNIRRVNFWTIGDIYSIRPNLFNEFRAGLVILVSQSDADVKGQELIDEFGIQGLPPRPGVKGIPNMSVVGLTSVGQLLLNPVNDGHAQFSDNVTWIAGRHTLKFGGEVIPWFVNRYLPAENALFGNFSFTNRFTGQPYADYLLGLPTTVTRLDPYYTQYNRFIDLAFYAQDDFKLTPRLTLSYGLRYEYNQPVRALDGNMYSFDLGTGSIVVPSADSRRLFSPYLPSTIPVINANSLGLGEGLRGSDKNNWAPRFGFSYQIGSQARTVLRGGWGIYYAHFSGNVAGGLAAGPFAISTTSTNNFVNGQPLFTFANPFASPGASGALNLNAISPTMGNSRTMQYTLSLEHEIVRDLGIRMSYIGSKSAQMIYRRNVNQPLASTMPFANSRRPYPLFNNIIYSDNGANGYYSGSQVQVSKRFSQGIHFSSAWTWAKSISEIDDTGDFELNTLIENSYDRRRERADLYSVPRHQWMNQVLWELPFSPDSPALRAMAGGWQLNGLVNLQSGNFLNPLFAGSDPSNTNTIGGRPDVAKSTVDMPKTLTAWYDRTAFVAPPTNAGRFGNAGRNSIQGPGYVVFNFGVQKNVRSERYGTLQLGASFQNILNHPNYGEPNMTVNNAAGGTITATHIFPAAGSPRTGQISLRWTR
jgi:outer membrane receptor protein involved in Fe transport